jgi:glycosyltransferase involved in cell wall biosynthesis
VTIGPIPSRLTPLVDGTKRPIRILLAANSDWYLFNFREALFRELQKRGCEVHLASPDGPWRSRLEAMGFCWHPLPLDRRGVNPFAEMRALLAFRRLQRNLKPDLVHHFTLQCVVWGTLAGRTSARPMAVVNALTGLGSIFRGGGWKGRLLKPCVKGLLRLAIRGRNTHTIFQNPEDMHFCVASFGLSPATVHLIRGSGVDPHRFRPVIRSWARPTVLFVGRLLRDKGICEFLEVAKALSFKHHEWRFLVVGSTDPGSPTSLDDREVRAFAQRIPNVEFLGHREDMPEIFAGAHLLVLPTRYGEGVPRSLIEGAAAGLPLVASNHPGCREIVRPGVNGVLVPPGSSKDLQIAVESILEDQEAWERLSRASRGIAEFEFSEASVNLATLEVYRKVLGSIPHFGK